MIVEKKYAYIFAIITKTQHEFNRFTKQPHRPKTEGSGGRHKKRVRQPYSTRERQRQLATQHGEYIMPQDNSHYRAPHQVNKIFLPKLTVLYIL